MSTVGFPKMQKKTTKKRQEQNRNAQNRFRKKQSEQIQEMKQEIQKVAELREELKEQEARMQQLLESRIQMIHIVDKLRRDNYLLSRENSRLKNATPLKKELKFVKGMNRKIPIYFTNLKDAFTLGYSGNSSTTFNGNCSSSVNSSTGNSTSNNSAGNSLSSGATGMENPDVNLSGTVGLKLGISDCNSNSSAITQTNSISSFSTPDYSSSTLTYTNNNIVESSSKSNLKMQVNSNPLYPQWTPTTLGQGDPNSAYLNSFTFGDTPILHRLPAVYPTVDPRINPTSTSSLLHHVKFDPIPNFNLDAGLDIGFHNVSTSTSAGLFHHIPVNQDVCLPSIKSNQKSGIDVCFVPEKEF